MNACRSVWSWNTACAICALALWGAEASAQSLFGNRGPTGGQSSFGGTQSFGRAGTSGIGTTGSRSAFSGSSGFGSTSSFGGIQSGLGSAGGFGQGVSGSSLGQGQNTFGQASGFGGAQQPGTMVGFSNAGGFVGASALGQQQAFQQFGNSTRFNRGSAGNFNQGQRGGQQQQPQRAIRPRQRVAFEYDQPTVASVNTTVQTRLERLSTRRPEIADVTFTLDASGVATLRGSVVGEEASRLAEAFVRIEPGVRQVNNQLTVASN